MPRGSMRGEHRGGRHRGTANRRTILIDRILAVGLELPTARPGEFVAALAGDQALPGDTRRALAPKLLLTSGGRGLELKALFRIVQDASVASKERRKAALAVSKVLLPERPAVTKWRATADQYGFAVNPERADEYRNKCDQLHKLKTSGRADIPAVAQTIGKLQADLDRILQRSPGPCPTKYDKTAIYEDRIRLQYFRAKLHAGRPLTDDEKTEEAHRRLRFESFTNGPEQTARRRRQELEALAIQLARERFFEKRTARLSRKAAAELRMLRWLYPPLPPSQILDGEDDWRAEDHPFTTEQPAAA